VYTSLAKLPSIEMLADQENFTLAVFASSVGTEVLNISHSGTSRLSIDKSGSTTVFGSVSVRGANSTGGNELRVENLTLGSLGSRVQINCQPEMMNKDLFGNAVWSNEVNHCFFVSRVRQNFAAATLTCQQHGAHIVTLNSNTENDHVKGLLLSDQSAFIGLSDVGTPSAFRWVNGEFGPWAGTISVEHGSYYHGAGRSDNRHTKHCVVVTSDGGWDLADCDSTQYFVCEHNAAASY
jgi:hypothetical protein